MQLTLLCCFLVFQLMQSASMGALSSLASDRRSPACFGSSSREVTGRCPPPPLPHHLSLPRQAMRSLPCLVETAPLRLARSAAVWAQLRLRGAHVARFHLWVSVWPQEWVDIRLVHARKCGNASLASKHINRQKHTRTDTRHKDLCKDSSCTHLLRIPFSAPHLSYPTSLAAPLYISPANLLLKHVIYTRSSLLFTLSPCRFGPWRAEL